MSSACRPQNSTEFGPVAVCLRTTRALRSKSETCVKLVARAPHTVAAVAVSWASVQVVIRRSEGERTTVTYRAFRTTENI